MHGWHTHKMGVQATPSMFKPNVMTQFMTYWSNSEFS